MEQIKKLVFQYGMKSVLESLIVFVNTTNKDPTEFYLTKLSEDLKAALYNYEDRNIDGNK